MAALKPAYDKRIIGGTFDVPMGTYTADQLAHLFKTWSEEAAAWKTEEGEPATVEVGWSYEGSGKSGITLKFEDPLAKGK